VTSWLHFLQGMLGIGASLLGSSHVLGVDIDPDALMVAQANADEFEGIQVAVTRPGGCGILI
jgi:predicted RNA methylase